jgi:hypothetical protein
MFKKHTQLLGLAATVLFSFAVLSLYYGNLFDKLNQVCFANGGDGMQSYVNMNYHIRFDKTYLRCNSMNYPYGEHDFFTNNQPLISNTIKFISGHIVDISAYTLGILNFMMLFCLLVAPLFIYLILTRLGAGKLLSVLASVPIAYLSPQIDRFGGHFTLSYVCVIPLMIYLLMRFFNRPSVVLSMIISLTVMAGALTHFYIYGFFAILILFFYAAHLPEHDKVFQSKISLALHFFVQLVLPFLILQLFYISDHVTDRPAYPWGFLVYRAYPQSIFLPLGRPYGQFLHRFIQTGYIDWEGYAFVGMLAASGALLFLFRFFRKLTLGNFKEIWKITPQRQLNIVFWASVTALLYSFGLPFILGLQWLVDLIGPVRQMRGIARFSWMFFYVMNIVTVYWLWLYWKNTHRKFIALLILAAGLCMLSYDAWYNIRNRGAWLENHIPALVDRDLRLPENQWIKRVDLTRYQAMIPIPYFHIGSENIWIDGGCDIVTQSFIALNNSGLPSMGAMLSRTSLSQTVENVSLMLDPSGPAVALDRFPSHKPFLIMAARCDIVNEHEKQMIGRSKWIDSTGAFDLYEMPYGVFNAIADSITSAVSGEYAIRKLFDYQGLKSTDSLLTFRFVDYDSLPDPAAFAGAGCFHGRAGDRNELFSGWLPNCDTSQTYTLSFWLNRVRSDLYPRSQVTFMEIDSSGNAVFNESYPVSKQFVMIKGNWALVTRNFRLKDARDKIVISIQNSTLRKKPLEVDNLLIMPEKGNVYLRFSEGIRKNNRYFGSLPK